MTTRFIQLGVTALLILAGACHSPKKTKATATENSGKTTVVSAPTSTVAPAGPSSPFSVKPETNSVHAPGNEELTAIQAKFPEVTMQLLAEGHKIYTGTCTNCHNAKNIYKFTEAEWPQIIDDMALRSKLTSGEKDAVYKYVMSIKATQP